MATLNTTAKSIEITTDYDWFLRIETGNQMSFEGTRKDGEPMTVVNFGFMARMSLTEFFKSNTDKIRIEGTIINYNNNKSKQFLEFVREPNGNITVDLGIIDGQGWDSIVDTVESLSEQEINFLKEHFTYIVK